jgi:hypothetical protein
MISTEDPAMIAEESTMHDWLRLIQAEYLEMPGLMLTKPQVRRLWGLEPQVCDALLKTLVATGFLKVTDEHEYALADGADSRSRQGQLSR